ncbi:MAG: glycoside hydrolase family 1 protein [Deltaproteobacteria bacterium]|nr:glycoside hydrolase family 1 protein [Deltaproteobacteria bacterium]
MNRASIVVAASLGLLYRTPRPGLDGASIDLAELGKGLPRGFKLGAATAAHQVEGGRDNDWTAWERTAFPDGRPHAKHNDPSGLACDSWNRFKEDLQMLNQLGAKSYRFSVEWSRLEPRRGEWNAEAMDRDVFWTRRLREEGIEPLVTVWHFTLPTWVAEQGAFENAQSIADTEAFTVRLAQALGPTVDGWVTLNEPNIHAAKGYLQGEWPPGRKGDTRTQAQVMANLLRAHAKMAAALRTHDTADADGDTHATRVSVAHHARIFQPATNSTLDTAIAGLTDDFFNESVPRALVTGRIRLSVPGTLETDEQVDGLKGSIAYLGLNCYARVPVRADLSNPALSNQYVRSGGPTNDQGWEPSPDGLYLLLMRLNAWGVPLVITENGLADSLGEDRRAFLAEHL